MRLSLAALLLSLALPAQNVIVVQGGGAALQQAVTAASPGDILDVMPASYTAVSVTRGLRLSLRPGVLITAAGNSPALAIVSLPAGEACVVAGGAVQGIAARGCAGAVVWDGVDLQVNSYGAVIDGCTGPVASQAMTGGTLYNIFDLVQVLNSQQVSFQGGTMPSFEVTNSNVTCDGVVIPKHNQKPGLLINSGSVSIAGGSMAGGNFFSWPIELPGIRLVSGSLTVTGGATIEAETYWRMTISNMPPVAAIETVAGTVRIDPSVALVTWPGAPLIGGGATVIPMAIPSITVARAPQSPNYQLAIAAEPNSLAFTAISLPFPVLPLPFGDLWVHPQSAILSVTVMPPSGTAGYSGALQGVPPYLILVVQSVVLTPAGSVVLGVPARFVWD